mmetsp:Transcript_104647/g.197147  ORF Transcript_104647/g.197147 Transcript_104647/m.197147 type:complete len:203 (+) Transcript_104647:84-692(+)
MTALTIPVKVVDGLTGEDCCSFNVEGAILVQDVKTKIEDALKIPSVEQRLFVQGQLLKSNRAPLLDFLDETRVVSLLRADGAFECSLAAPLPPILGMIVCPEGSGSLLVRSDKRKGFREGFIRDTGIDQWNDTHEIDNQIILGDSIIMVNDVGSDSQAMLNELRTADLLTLLVQPGTTRKRSAGMLEMKRASFQNKMGDVAL